VDDKTVIAHNSSPPPESAPHPDVLCCATLKFIPSPSLEEMEEHSIAASDDQAKLICWHYHLGHASFQKLKQLALNGEITKKLAQICTPRCRGCLLGAMKKVPWCGKECKNNHTIFIATKPGECISINHFQLTKPGFYGQAKGSLTKTRYKNATIFVDHFSCLQFVYLMTSNLTSSKTIDAKRAFEHFAADHRVQNKKHYHCNNVA
jgi:hypothetical protein